ncbi:2-amino-4-hydroxy-6-hydroxymethyldihydropteridine diphosphokinase [Cryobacterium psychrophilum]|uniref:2-amino-4-hydroxy-6-hydroxymethyldihydropteridine diphosphokinase n=1 Tax=Cryobacterium psychrophilum TaxID=41988 RepID=A0A4Y8KJS8_9MICO|nr:2-amino-4-hydroxy-6-hydroxymethyldihydropteridine diphosphokinase [Cryobacterium psychrophilum]TDW29917.1 2-amino-4-hydroxy-6-hydroxymethyldihydropteridine diphosphokinase [Cryobacterium psychrophilum]TFD76482.1 2-amino-4-hydroxy-6-hydroxymethyldihydropteridine diphosphokinase [Cryobacterium psychrophilum]
MSALPVPPVPGRAHVVLALGSNLGDRAATLASAAHDLADLTGFDLTGVSPAFESVAVKPDGVDDTAPRYLNSVVTGRYAGEAVDLLDAVNDIEARHGRVRAERWGDRTLDIDIIAVDDLELDTARLTLPHPRAWERDFVLAPWLRLDADAAVPGRGLVRDLLAATDNTVVPARATGATL